MAEVYHKYIRAGEQVPQPSEEQIKRGESDAKFREARARKESALADLREAESKRRSGELIEKAIAVRQAAFLFVSCRQKMLALPAQLARKCVGKSQHEIRMIIDGQICECLTELSELPERVTQKQLDYFNEAKNGGKQPVKRKAPRPAAS